jgi:hypothetical protein
VYEHELGKYTNADIIGNLETWVSCFSCVHTVMPILVGICVVKGDFSKLHSALICVRAKFDCCLPICVLHIMNGCKFSLGFRDYYMH